MAEETIAVEPLNSQHLETDTICQLLRANDPRLTEVTLQDSLFCDEVQRIGEALQENTIVTSIDVEFSAFVEDEYFSVQLATTIDIDRLVTKATTTADPLLRYIRDSSELRKMRLENSDDEILMPVDEHLSSLFYRALADNPHQLLQELRIDYTDQAEKCQTEFSLLLTTAKSLKRLTMFAYMPVDSSDSWLVEALRSSKSLEYLEYLNLRNNGDGQAATFLGIVLRSEVHLRLHELHFSLCSDREIEFFDFLAVLLGSTGALQILRLDHVWFDERCACCFVEGLKSSGTLQSVILGNACFFYNDDALSHLLLSKTIRPSILHGVCVQNNNRIDFLGDALLWKPQDRLRSIGSSLGELRLCTLRRESEHAIVELLDVFAASAAMIRLKILEIESISILAAEAMIRCLPKLVNLREVKILCIQVEERETLDRFFKSFKLNGSLHRVDLAGDMPPNARAFVMSESLLCRLLSYGERNREIPKLVSKAAVAGHDRPSAVPAEPNAIVGNNALTSICVFPFLFYASQQARRMAPTNILCGLLCLSAHINPQNGKKRSLDA
jgi:hypothetical protein